jgi:hypothetical protein
MAVGCGTGWESYGEAAGEEAEALLARARGVESLAEEGPAGPAGGTRVVLRGRVGEVCHMGCWFYLVDEKDLVYVKLDMGTGFVIPPDSAGAEAVVLGTLRGSGAEREIKAERVLLRD